MNSFFYIFALSLCFFAISTTTDAKEWNELYQIYKNAKTSGNYIEPGTKELNQAQFLFRSLFFHQDLSGLKQALKELHLKVVKMELNSKELLILIEEKTHRTGRGFYIFWNNKDAQNVLQMPHSQKDLYTGKIGLSLFVEGNFAAGAWNTVPRHYKQGTERVSADLCDFHQSYFIEFSKAFAHCHSKGHIIQLHGFSPQKRKAQAGKQSTFIISSGSWKQNRQLVNLDRCFEKNFFLVSSLYPFEINELGGTQNTVGKTLRQMGHNGFIHLEMNKSIRNKLCKEQSMREKLLKCIEGL